MLRKSFAVMALVLLSACSGDPEPREPAPSPSASPTATPPDMPDLANEESDEGAAAFVAHYVDVFNFAATTGDVTRLRELSSSACEGCSAYIDLYRETYEAGGFFRNSDWSIRDIAVEKLDNQYFAYVRVTAPTGDYRTTSQGEIKRGNSEDTNLVFVASKATGDWQLMQLGLESELEG